MGCAGVILVYDFVHVNVDRSTFVGEIREGAIDRIQEAGGSDIGSQEWLYLGYIVTHMRRISRFLDTDYARTFVIVLTIHGPANSPILFFPTSFSLQTRTSSPFDIRKRSRLVCCV